MKLNLITSGFQDSNLFAHMPQFDSIYDEGMLEKKVRRYTAIREGQTCSMLVLNVIRKDEDIIWNAFEDLVKRSVTEAAFGIRGVFTFDLLAMNIHHEINTYNHKEATTVLINNARKSIIGEKRLMKYSSVYGLIQKLNNVDWGKITFKTAVEVFKDKDHFLDLLLKRLLKGFEFSNIPGILLLNDLSQQPIFNLDDEMQQKRLQTTINKLIPTSIEFIPEVYIQDKNGVKELLSQNIVH